jgi:large subunit ribosomal protein L6
MSRLGKKPIEIPEGVDVEIKNSVVSVKGPKGILDRDFKDFVKIDKQDKIIQLLPVSKGERAKAFWGTYTSHLKNMIEGVKEGFSKELVLEGVGFRVAIEGKDLVFNVGFSHPVKFKIPEGVEIKVEKNNIEISGIDKQLVGQTAAEIRALKKPEPYKGKGIRYKDEVVRRKAGKKAVGGPV